MQDLLTFKNNQIKALQDEVARLNERNVQLSTWVFELCDDETPREYKDQVLLDVTNKF